MLPRVLEPETLDHLAPDDPAGSSGARWSSVSGSRTRGSMSVDLQQGTVAAEARAERRQPPPSAGRIVGERGIEHEVDEGAREVAVFAQHRRAVAKGPAVLELE